MGITVRVAVVCLVLGTLMGTVRAEPPASSPTEYKRTRVGHRGLAKGMFLGGAIGIGGSIGVSLYEKGKYNDAVDRNDIAAANHAASVARWIGTPLFLAGLACIPVGIVLWIKSDTVVLTPITTPSGGAGASLSLTF